MAPNSTSVFTAETSMIDCEKAVAVAHSNHVSPAVFARIGEEHPQKYMS